MSDPRPSRLTIANSVRDLVQGDIQEHLPLERIPLDGDVIMMALSGRLRATASVVSVAAHDGSAGTRARVRPHLTPVPGLHD